MSFDLQLARSFFEPLKAKSSILLVPDSETSLIMAKHLLACVRLLNCKCFIIDTDAFYASHADELTSDAGEATLYIPNSYSDSVPVVEALADLIDIDVILIDNINSLFHTLSSHSSGTASRKFSVMMSVLSYIAKTELIPVISIMYYRKTQSSSRGRSISDYADMTLFAQKRHGRLVLKAVKGAAWSTDELLL